MTTVLAFVVAMALLIAVHEYGHYRMARACGVNVLRFSIGFGKVLLRWRVKGNSTEFVLGAFPFGGYVKMLDEREAPVAPEERHLAFNQQRLRSRVAIVAAGPLANLALAVLLYSLVHWGGVDLPKAVLASPLAGSVAQQAGLRGGEWVKQGGLLGQELRDVDSFDDLRWLLTQGALQGQSVRLLFERSKHDSGEVTLKLGSLQAVEVDSQLFRKIGLLAPFSPALMGEIMAGGAAEQAGLRAGDRVLKVDGREIRDAAQLRELIRNSVQQLDSLPQVWEIQRGTQQLTVEVLPMAQPEGDARIGRIHAFVGAAPEFVTVRYGLGEGLWLGLVRTWDVSVLTLRMMGRVVVGQASLKNLSGPLTIADYAGKSASLGWSQYLLFLAMISVSLGVLNLLPLPMLDGGHLMYYLWEALTGNSVPDVWMERLQRVGVALLLLLMSIALFNDLTRMLG